MSSNTKGVKAEEVEEVDAEVETVLIDHTAVHVLVIDDSKHLSKEVARYPINLAFIALCDKLAAPKQEKGEIYRCTYDGDIQLCMSYMFRFVDHFSKQPMFTDRIQVPLKHLKLPVQVWYTRFVQEVFQDVNLIEELIYFACWFQVKPLLTLLCANMANKLVNRHPHELFTIFHATQAVRKKLHDHVLFNMKWKYSFRALDPPETLHLPPRFIAIFDARWKAKYPPYQLVYDLIPGNPPHISIDDIAGAGHQSLVEELTTHLQNPITCTFNAIRFSITKGHIDLLEYFLFNPHVLQGPNDVTSVQEWIDLAESRQRTNVVTWLRHHHDDLTATFFSQGDDEEEEEQEEEQGEESDASDSNDSNDSPCRQHHQPHQPHQPQQPHRSSRSVIRVVV